MAFGGNTQVKASVSPIVSESAVSQGESNDICTPLPGRFLRFPPDLRSHAASRGSEPDPVDSIPAGSGPAKSGPAHSATAHFGAGLLPAARQAGAGHHAEQDSPCPGDHRHAVGTRRVVAAAGPTRGHGAKRVDATRGRTAMDPGTAVF